MLQKFLSNFLLFCLTVILQVVIFINGWGMTPRNWWWIIVAGTLGHATLGVLRDKVNKG